MAPVDVKVRPAGTKSLTITAVSNMVCIWRVPVHSQLSSQQLAVFMW
jgi:hypothetical protein